MRQPRTGVVAAVFLGLIVVLLAACTAPGPAPTASPSSSGASGSPGTSDGSLSPEATEPRGLTSFAPDTEWRAVLELNSGGEGIDHGTFPSTGRYRIRLDCVGAGVITVRIEGQKRAARDCSDDQLTEPVVVSHAPSGTLRAAVSVRNTPDWIVLIEIPRE